VLAWLLMQWAEERYVEAPLLKSWLTVERNTFWNSKEGRLLTGDSLGN
jgi:hypothetical protein